MDSTRTSPELMKLTDSSKVAQNPRNQPSFFFEIRNAMISSISSFVMLPLSTKVMTPAASAAIAASIRPISGSSMRATLPLTSGANMMPHEVCSPSSFSL